MPFLIDNEHVELKRFVLVVFSQFRRTSVCVGIYIGDGCRQSKITPSIREVWTWQARSLLVSSFGRQSGSLQSAPWLTIVDQLQSVVVSTRSSSAAALFDDHVVKDADDLTPVEVVSQRQRSQPCRRACRARYRQSAAAGRRRRHNQLADGGVVVRSPVSGRTGAVAVVRLVAVRSENPVVPAELAERDPERSTTTASLVVIGSTQRHICRRRQRDVWKH